MRFRKRISLGKNIRLNISKSGVSTTIGVPGLSVNIGKNGAYLNTSIPGTGLYDRHKLTGPKKKKVETSKRKSTKTSLKEEPEFSYDDYDYLITEDGNVEFYLDGELVTNKKILSKLKNHPKLIEELNEKKENNIQEAKEASNEMINVVKLSRPVQSVKVYQDKLASLNGINAPKTQELKELLENNPDLIEEKICNWVAELEFPFEFDIELAVNGDSVYVDLDLPEVEDMVDNKIIGTNRNITEKEINEDYLNCVLGLAIFFASYIFNIAVGASEVVISGYTQRRNDIGDLIDDYIYSVKFDREKFVDINFEDNAEDIFMEFTNRCNLTLSKHFKSIKPYEL